MKFYRSPSLLTATEGGQPSFHVVALGLPGFAFSEGTKNTGKGFVLNHYAEVGVAQAGDLGAVVPSLL
ncbi:hypothetical protein E1B28_013163 [Marasmius oreades]|uniref:Uncharacterized protein n=1 Tax=Marasmius oreades TaxID=181124 RepID=A0A9P7UMD5_9AGAR|nr:uncharacterized protein E1B28_013163 [Marasmius oreades]KAG7087183.1 hypothetical protein E1B28_013163 [Marasmius oreades]